MLQTLVSQAESIPVDTKAQQVKRYIQQLLEDKPNEKLLLFTEYRDTLDYLLEEMSDQPWADEILVIHGDVSKDDRQQIEDQFNHGEPRLLFATDAASEGIDLQHSCHIMINYELPWNPNRLEQRIGRIHRYGQNKEVKVWNFQFEGTREGEIFKLLEEKVENIRSKVGATADVLGMLEDVDIDDLIMRSVQNKKPPEATAAELKELMEDREQTLLEWYDRSLIDPSTFDAESRQRIQEVMDESSDIFGTEADIRAFVERGLETYDGRLEKRGSQLYVAHVPPVLSENGAKAERGPMTFLREFAMEHEGISYLSPDDPLVQRLRAQLLADAAGTVGLKLLPFIDSPGITFVYRVAFEDGTGETIQEELIPVFVDLQSQSPRRPIGEQVLDAETIRAKPETGTVHELISNKDQLETVAESYVANVLKTIKSELTDDRNDDVEQERSNLEKYAAAERERIEDFITEYQQQAESGQDMEISIRRQRQRLEELEERVEERSAKLDQRKQVISLAPTVEGYCLTLPVD